MSSNRIMWALMMMGIWTASVAQAQQSEYVPGEVLVKFKDSASVGGSGGVASKTAADKAMDLKRAWGKMRMYQYGLQKGQSVEQAVEELNSDPNVEYAEPNFILRKASDVGILETYTPEEIQDIVSNDGVEALGIDASVQSAWKTSQSVSTQSAGRPVVAVIDTGLDISHPVFQNTGAIWTNSNEIPGNGIDDDGNGYIDDVNGWNFVSKSGVMLDDDGHGTHVAGIIMTVDQNIHAPTGSLVASKIQIMPLKFLDSSGAGSTSDAIEAIYYAVDHGAQVLNNSWGGSSYSASLHEAVAYSYRNGASFIAAAGNTGTNNDASPMYPASYDAPNLISVAATYDDYSLTNFSNYGSSTVHLGGWGYFINSTVPNGQFGDSSGTSMSAPFVAGTAIQMLVESPNMLGFQLRSIVEEETEFQSMLANRVSTQGRLHPSDSISKASSATVLTEQPSYNVNFSQNRELASEIAGGGCGVVSTLLAKYAGKGGGSGGSGGIEFQGPRAWYVLLVMALLLAPMLIATHLRQKSMGKNRRVHDRYKIDSDVRVQVGGKELVASVSSISLGGVQLNTDELLENGGVVAMTIRSPEGQEQIQVEGRVVWSEDKKAYGVAFQNTPLSVLDRISNWTQSLVKAS